MSRGRIVIAGLLLVLGALLANHWFAPLLLIDPLDRYIYETRRNQPTNELMRQYVELVPAVIARETPVADVAARLRGLGYEEHTKGDLIIRLFVKPAGGRLFCNFTYELWLHVDKREAVESAEARVESSCF